MKMTPEQIKTMFEDINGLKGKVTYRLWKVRPDKPEIPSMPYLAFYSPREISFSADNIVYYTTVNYQAELYSKETVPALETAVEGALNTAGLFWTKEKEFLDDQQCWVVIYNFNTF